MWQRIRRAVRRLFFWLVMLALGWACTIALLVLLLRWVPAYTSAFMIEKTVAAALRGDETYELQHAWVSWGRISPHAKVAVIAAEDLRFPGHHGFDFDAMADAWEDYRAGGRLRGGSTISQQVAKNLFLWPGRSFARKGLEAYITVLIEAMWSKQRILEVYLNSAEMGRGIFGVEAASRAFFGKPAARLTPREAALLAAVLPNPIARRADAPSPALRRQRDRIQRRMERIGGPRVIDGLDGRHAQ